LWVSPLAQKEGCLFPPVFLIARSAFELNHVERQSYSNVFFVKGPVDPLTFFEQSITSCPRVSSLSDRLSVASPRGWKVFSLSSRMASAGTLDCFCGVTCLHPYARSSSSSGSCEELARALKVSSCSAGFFRESIPLHLFCLLGSLARDRSTVEPPRFLFSMIMITRHRYIVPL